MSTTPVSLNSVTYFVPQPGEKGPTYDQDLTNYLIALASAFPQVTGVGTGFTALTSATANPASAGQIRLAHSDLVDWRNNANSANLALGVGVSLAGGVDDLSWAGTQLTGQAFAEYNTTAAQSLANGATTVVNYATAVTDTDSAVTTGAAWHFTVPANKAGRYLVAASFALATAQVGAAPGSISLGIYKNAVEVQREQISLSTAVHGVGSAVLTASIINCAVGDLLDARAFQNSGAGAGAINLSGLAVGNRIIIQRLV